VEVYKGTEISVNIFDVSEVLLQICYCVSWSDSRLCNHRDYHKL